MAFHAPCWPVWQQCQPLSVSPSGYCAWWKRAPLTAAPALAAWQVAAQRVFSTHAGRYGQRWLRAQLRREGHLVGRQRLRGWHSARGLRALCTRASSRPPRTTQADPQVVAAANRLASWLVAPPFPTKLGGDSSCLALATGHWVYLACLRDAFSGAWWAWCRRGDT